VMADLSVDHANTLDHYRAATTISQRAAEGAASTEDLRQATIHYRALFRDLLGTTSEQETPARTAQREPGPEMNEPDIPGQQGPEQPDADPVTGTPAAEVPQRPS
jgi:hypothetical protein